MKMGALEKRVVNDASHSRRVALQAIRRIQELPYWAHQKYLDVGCGNGAAGLRIASVCGLAVTGVDVDPEQIRLGVEKVCGSSQVRFMVGDATRLPFGDGEFDYVATNKAMHHITDWESALKEMVRVLKPGGYLLYSDFVLPGWLVRLVRWCATGESSGLPTRSWLDRFAARSGLLPVRVSARGLSYEAIWQRAGLNSSSFQQGFSAAQTGRPRGATELSARWRTARGCWRDTGA